MAAHDFASKKKTPKPKTNKSKPAKNTTPTPKQNPETTKKPKKKIPAIIWIVIGISLAFGGQHAFKTLKSSPEVSQVIEDASKTISATTEKVLEPVKEIKEEAPRFEFYELLKNNKVEVSIKEDEAPKAKNFVYIVQAGSFRKKEDAEHMRSQLILNNLTNTTTDSITTKNGTWYRVNVGPFTNRSKLEKARDTLAALNIQDLVKKVPLKK